MDRQLTGLVVIAGVTLAMMGNTALKKWVFEKEEWARPNEEYVANATGTNDNDVNDNDVNDNDVNDNDVNDNDENEDMIYSQRYTIGGTFR
jgi:hypothetical protein